MALEFGADSEPKPAVVERLAADTLRALLAMWSAWVAASGYVVEQAASAARVETELLVDIAALVGSFELADSSEQADTWLSVDTVLVKQPGTDSISMDSCSRIEQAETRQPAAESELDRLPLVRAGWTVPVWAVVSY